MIAGPPLTDTELPLKLFARGKVRDTYELSGDQLLMVATDRISAFDHVLPNGVPDRGKVLTQLSIFWFSQTDTFQANHLISGMVPDLPAVLKNFREDLAGRFMIVRKAKRIDFECVVRGYLAGSAWKEYEESQTLAGEKMPPGLRQSEKLAAPIFSPATKADSGHDQNITFEQMKKELGDDLAAKLREASLELYKYASEFAARRGLILADTKCEFGQIGDATGTCTPTRSARLPSRTTSSSCATGSPVRDGTRNPSRRACPTTWSPRRACAISPPTRGWSASRCFRASRGTKRDGSRRGVQHSAPIDSNARNRCGPGARLASNGRNARSPRMIARVIITPKPVVNDPQGLTVKQGLASLGFREVTDVRVGKYIEVNIEGSSEHEARRRVEEMCRQLLANHVIEDFRFDIEQEHKRR